MADLTGFAALGRVAVSVKSNATVEYWKSVPYFINFMDGYQLADRVRATQDRCRAGAAGTPFRRTQRLDRAALEGFRTRPRQRTAAGTRGRDGRSGMVAAALVPPSMPYLTPAGPYADSSRRA